MKKPSLEQLYSTASQFAAQAGARIKNNSETAYDWSVSRVEELIDSQQALDQTNWFERAAKACERLSDSVVGQSGYTDKAVSIVSGKLAGIAVPASMFSIAGLVGTASTGTAIGSLSGVAFTSSALAWLGGSVAMGTVLVSGAAVVGALSAPFVVKPLAKNYVFGNQRNLSELNDAEKRLVDACSALALGFRQAARGQIELESGLAEKLDAYSLTPIVEVATEVITSAQNYPIMQRRAFNNAFTEVAIICGFLKEEAKSARPVVIGIASAFIVNLLSADNHVFSDAEKDILDALRRSSSALSAMSNAEIAEHVQALTPLQLQGFKNNVKGIAHEIQFARNENSDGDEFIVELFEATNHPGADVKLINLETGEAIEYQLKATSYGAYVESHFDRYKDIAVMTTSEVAAEHGFETTGISNHTLSENFDSATEKLASHDESQILESVALAGLLSLALNVRMILNGTQHSSDKKITVVKDSMRAGLVAGIMEIII